MSRQDNYVKFLKMKPDERTYLCQKKLSENVANENDL